MRIHRLLLSLSLLLPAATLAAPPVQSVESLDLSRYAGQWHQIAHLPTPFQKKCVADVTASYGLRADGRISVHNRCRKADSGVIEAEGTARPVEGHPGRLQVRLAGDWLAWLPWAWADYWVIALDPEYQWAVIGEPDRDYLWILSRTPTMDAALFDSLKQRATDMGYELTQLKATAPIE